VELEAEHTVEHRAGRSEVGAVEQGRGSTCCTPGSAGRDEHPERQRHWEAPIGEAAAGQREPHRTPADDVTTATIALVVVVAAASAVVAVTASAATPMAIEAVVVVLAVAIVAAAPLRWTAAAPLTVAVVTTVATVWIVSGHVASLTAWSSNFH
jgi:hypothetical protein